MHLSDLKEGQSGKIAKVRGMGAFRRRIIEMGFVKGKEVTVVKKAPLRDPIEYSIMGYDVSLRQDEAELIELQDPNHVEVLEDYYNAVSVEEGSFRTKDVPKSKVINVALVGNPNCGKTTIFNHVSGLNERVGNYGGVTVDSKLAHFKQNGYVFNIVDLPGTYSITSYSPEELYVRKHILEEMPDVVVNVLDASNIERNLYLTTQLIDMDVKVVIALNMFDEMERNGDLIDMDKLGYMLGAPIIPTVGKRKEGVQKLFDKVIDVFEDKDPQSRHLHINYGKVLEKIVQLVKDRIKIPENAKVTDRISARFMAIKLLEDDDECKKYLEQCSNDDEIRLLVNERVQDIESYFKESAETAVTDAKYGFINGALKETYKANTKIDKRKRTKVLDSFITDRLYGFPIFIFFMWIMFQSTFFVGAYPQAWLELGVNWIGDLFANWIPEGVARDLVVDGVIGGVGGVIVFLPNILILFFFISLMEDTGYMARVAFIVDKLMHRIGLHGRSFIPLLMGFGCNVPAIMATRTIENRNDRLVTMLINPFMSCSARLPVYVLIISAFFPDHPGSMLFLMYSLGIGFAGIIAWIFKKTLFKADELPFVMELPPYRAPSINTILKHMWFKAAMFLKKMSGVILIASLIIWALGYFPLNKEYSKDYDAEVLKIENAYNIEKQGLDAASLAVLDSNFLMQRRALSMQRIAEEQEQSYIGQLGHFVEPAIAPLGFDWKMGVSLITGMAAKEIVVSTMGVLYQNDPEIEGTQSLVAKLQNEKWEEGPRKGEKKYSPLVGLAFMIFVLLYVPCIATITAIRRESGAWKYAIFSVTYSTLLAWTMAFLVYQVGSLFI
jgi:ferrous iron transport protein B